MDQSRWFLLACVGTSRRRARGDRTAAAAGALLAVTSAKFDHGAGCGPVGGRAGRPGRWGAGPATGSRWSLLGSAVGHVEITHQHHRTLDRRARSRRSGGAADGPSPARTTGGCWRRRARPAGVSSCPITAARGSSSTTIDLARGAQVERKRSRDPGQPQDLPGRRGIARQQGDPVRRRAGHIVLRKRRSRSLPGCPRGRRRTGGSRRPSPRPQPPSDRRDGSGAGPGRPPAGPGCRHPESRTAAASRSRSTTPSCSRAAVQDVECRQPHGKKVPTIAEQMPPQPARSEEPALRAALKRSVGGAEGRRRALRAGWRICPVGARGAGAGPRCRSCRGRDGR